MDEEKWEYKVAYIDYYFAEQRLNELGERGWEIMDWDRRTEHSGIDYPAYKAVFKRRMQDG
ncbi:MAG: hypothetical protein GWN58_66320 [Anaerolineae bacterium]|nr:hypothetical protein [Anaerolineae bacterium]